MGVVAALFGEIISIVAFVLFATGVFKLFQIVTLLGEIRDQLGRQATSDVAPFAARSTPVADLRANDDAAEYAAKLLRAVNTEAHSTIDAPVSDSQ